MLTKQELAMQRMYEQLVGILLNLDLDGDLGEGTVGDSKSQGTSDQHTSVCNVDSSSHKSVADSTEGVESICSGVATLGKRKRSDSEDDSCIDMEQADVSALERSIDELLAYAVQVWQKEREEEEEEE